MGGVSFPLAATRGLRVVLTRKDTPPFSCWPSTTFGHTSLLSLSTDYATLFDVQPYSSFENMFSSPSTIIDYLRELAIHDLLFTIPQIEPSHVVPMARGLLDWIDLDRKRNTGWTVRECLTVAEVLLAVAPKHGPLCLDASAIESKCGGMERKQVFRVLNDVFSHPLHGPNREYQAPTDGSGPDLMFAPMIADGRGNFVLLDRAMCGPAFVEALFSLLRCEESGFDEKTGLAMERLLCNALGRRGVKTVSGRYDVHGQTGECDLVIETTELVVFIEMKKKPLTRAARLGVDTAILLDLADSLVHAQLQAGQHELLLREQGFLEVASEEGTRYRLERRGRDIERIAVTLFDYGSFHDRGVLNQFLLAGLRASFHPVDDSLKRRFDRLNAKLDRLRSQTAALASVDPRRVERPFFHCWFLSLPQLFVLLEDIESANTFKEALWETRHMSTGSLDFYFDYSYMKQLGRTAVSVDDELRLRAYCLWEKRGRPLGEDLHDWHNAEQLWREERANARGGE
jgi:hypothetical protein